MRPLHTIISVFVILATACSVFFSLSARAQGGESPVTGWLWGGSADEAIGCETPPCSPSTENTSGVGWVSLSSENPETSPSEAPYGVSVDEDGNITGYAWSSNFGWIYFSPGGPYPSAPDHGAKKDGSSVTGWARILSVATALNDSKFPPTETCSLGGNSGCFEGWIKLAGTAGDGSLYGTSIDSSNNLSGYGWSSEFGWIAFKGSGLPSTPAENCTNGLDDDGDGLIDENDIFDCPGTNPDAIIATCSASPTAPEIGDSVIWGATVFQGGGTNPNYAWLLPGATSVTGSGATVTAVYSTEGVKTAEATITNPETSESAVVSCQVEIFDELNQEEIDPFFPFF